MDDYISEEDYLGLGSVEEPDWILKGTETGNPILDNYKPKGRLIRVERDIKGRWTGVRGCNDQARAQKVFDAAFHAALKEMLHDYRHMNYIRSAGASNWKYRNGQAGPPDNNRWCVGWLYNGKAWAIFEVR